jgi:hypothetical protein
MPRLVHNQTNFTAGEISPRMRGRGDVARYQNGADTIENGVVVVQGGVVRRDGLRFLAETKDGGARRARLFRYSPSVTQSYALEFGHLYIRVFDGATGAIILDAGLSTLEIVSPYAEDQLDEITTVQSGDALLIFHGDVPTQQLRRLSATQWSMQAVPWTVKPFAEIGHQPNARLSLSAATVGTGRTFTTSAVTAPDAPTIGAASPLNAAALVAFTAPANNGGLPITSYTATSSPGGLTGSGAVSPIRVNGLTNGVAYTFTVTATNGVGTGAASAASGPVTPLDTLPTGSIIVTASSTNLAIITKNGPQTVLGPEAFGAAGTDPYAYAWTILSSSPNVSITRANTAQVQLASENYTATNYATLRCTVTDADDSIGVIDVNVSIEHRAPRAPEDLFDDR